MDFRTVLFGFGATLLGYYFWKRGAQATSLIRGTATSKIASAAKGYAELNGVARAPTQAPLRDPITHQPCLWFAVVTEKFSFWDKCRWRVVKTARSNRPLVIDDGSAKCLVLPSEADIDERDPSTVVKERINLRHKVWRICDGDPIFAIGHLQRTSDLTMQTMLRDHAQPSASPGAAVSSEQQLTERATDLLRQWKRDQKKLLARFDADGDGRIDDAEWDVARTTAREQVSQQTRQPERPAQSLTGTVQQQPASPSENPSDITHRLHKPDDGRPFLLSIHGEQSVVRSSRKQSFWGMVFFVIGVITLLTLLKECVGGN